MNQFTWQDLYNAFFAELDDDDYLMQDAILAFPGDGDATAMITHLHAEDGLIIAHARFGSERLCYPALTWKEVLDKLTDFRCEEPKALNRVAAVGFPPDFYEANSIAGFRIEDGEIFAVASDEATIQ